MKDMEKLFDEELTEVSGGLQKIKNAMKSASMMKVQCSHCHTNFDIDLNSNMGYKCPKCGSVFSALG